MLIRDYLIAIILFGIVMTATAYMVVDMSHAYGLSPDTSFNSTYNSINSMQTRAEGMYSKLSEAQKSPSLYGVLVISSIGDIVMMMLGGFTTAYSLMTQVAADLMIPTWFVAAISAILMILIILAVVGAVLRSKL